MIGRRIAPSTQEEDKPKGFDDFELRLGDVMRGERATLSKSLLDVQRELRIKAAYIAAIEGCDLSAFDAPSFISGYVRSYARYLGLDADWAFERFCQESGFKPTHGLSALSAPAATAAPARRHQDVADALSNPSTPFIPKPEGFWSKIELRAVGSVMVLAALVGGLGYGGWTVLKEVQRVNLAPVDQAPSVVADIDPIDSARGTAPADQLASNETAPAAPGADGGDRPFAPQTLDVPVLVARDGPIAAIDPGVAATPAAPMASASVAGSAPLANGPAAPLAGGEATTLAATDPTAAASVQTTAGAPPEVELLAVRPSWVRVRAADGSTLFEKVMDAGERFVVPKLDQPPVARIGESGAVYFAVNGVAHGPAGKRGEVTKNIQLSPDALNQKYAVANVSSDGDLAKMISVADAAGVLPAPAAGAVGGE